MSETVGVEIKVVEIVPCNGSGKLKAVATVIVAAPCGFEVIIAGCQIRIAPDGRWLAQGPQWRHPHSGNMVALGAAAA
jgi:hypothetical protein